jgi:hypothetical protein
MLAGLEKEQRIKAMNSKMSFREADSPACK